MKNRKYNAQKYEITMKTVYLDNNATTRMDEAVLDAMLPYLTLEYGNSSSMHSFGGRNHHVIEQAREQVADLLGCDADEIIFTSGGTESDNTVIEGVPDSYPDKRHIITSRVEHPAVRVPCRQKQKKGYRLTELAVDGNGQIDLDELNDAIGDDTALVTIMYANNETGVIFPIERAAQIVKARGCVFHTDAVQIAGKRPLNLKDSAIDLLSISGHKLHGPKGVGVLYVRRGTRFSPFMIGGHQEGGKRAGTENVPAIVGLGKACELARKHMQDENERVRKLRDKLERGLVTRCPDARINGDTQNRLPNTTNISFEYIEGEGILLMLDQLGICASSGSACTSGSLEPSHVLRAMGIPFTAVHGSIRFSLSRYTTEEEIDYTIEQVPPIIRRLRAMSPFSPDKDKTPEAPVEREPEIRV